MNSEGRKIYILRHAERVDFISPHWITSCFDEQGHYYRRDLNLPKCLPKRKNGPKGWIKDSPLTNVGICQAKLIGEDMKDKDVSISAAYVSPAFRCIQTANAVLTELGIKDTTPLRIEPGLYEWVGFVENNFPELYTPEELISLGFNVDTGYVPKISIKQLKDSLKETVPDLYRRNYIAMQNVLADSDSNDNKNANVLIVAHAISLETCTRYLLGKTERAWSELKPFFAKVGLCSMLTLEEKSHTAYEFIKPPCGSITQSLNETFDWRIFLDA